MTSLCLPLLLQTASAARVREFLVSEDTPVDMGYQAMKLLEQSRPAVANEVLCLLFDVACYETEKVFPGSPVEAGRWFASINVGSSLDDGTEIPAGETEAEVQALAVAKLGLREKFYEPAARRDAPFADDAQSLGAFRHARSRSAAADAVRATFIS